LFGGFIFLDMNYKLEIYGTNCNMELRKIGNSELLEIFVYDEHHTFNITLNNDEINHLINFIETHFDKKI
jgi:hypothetical protein